MRYHVSGRVQGVFFRAFTEEKATMLGLKGWARNCNDGTVEVLALGPVDALERFYEYLLQGPPAAKVTEVKCVNEHISEFSHVNTFEILR